MLGGRPLRVISISNDEPTYRVRDTWVYPNEGVAVFASGAAGDDGEDRVHFWRPPMRLQHRAVDAHLRLALTNLQSLRAPHPGGSYIFGSGRMRRHFTQGHNHARILAAGRRRDSEIHVLPTCGWCGLPTGNFCDGFVCVGFGKDDPSRHTVRKCGGPVCTDCERIFKVCVWCSCWAGFPTQYVFTDINGAAG